MEAFLEEFEHLKIQLDEIKVATDNFGINNVIGSGGFGNVYQGDICHSKGRSVVAFKRLDRKHGQGDPEFWKEIMMLSRYPHENLISLLGFCNESGEKILVYEYASRGSLDRHLNSSNLTWLQRLKICLDAARGLTYLHDNKGTEQRVIHRDIKSSNILLDDNWNAKISDLGLSKIGPANQQHTTIFTNAVGTIGYVDPMYMEFGMLTKESDVYSFGVVLFEVMCGRLCFENSKDRVSSFVHMWKQSYKQKKLVDIIFQDLMQQMDSTSLETFSDIAFQCLQISREQRPTMPQVVEKLEIALESQDTSEGKEWLIYYEEIIRTAVPPLNYRSKAELSKLLSKGVLLNGGKTWFSINTNGEHCEMTSAAKCLIPTPSEFELNLYAHKYNSRFSGGLYVTFENKFKTHVRTQLLSPLITYAVNLVFRFDCHKLSTPAYIGLQYKLEGETMSSIAHLADKREDRWLILELYQFTSDGTPVDLIIQFEGSRRISSLTVVEGIEFRPLEKVEHEMLEDGKEDMLPISDSDLDWEQKLPDDYNGIIKSSEGSLQWTTKKELYFVLRNGFLINNGQEWFSLDGNGKNCQMLSARGDWVIHSQVSDWLLLPESRFGGALQINDTKFTISGEIKSQILSPQTTYATYLVYQPLGDESGCEGPVQVSDKDLGSDDFWFIYLHSPQTPVIKRKDGQNSHNPLSRPKMKYVPQRRSDGWMEVQVWEFQTDYSGEMIHKRLELSNHRYQLCDGIIMQGIEFRPT